MKSKICSNAWTVLLPKCSGRKTIESLPNQFLSGHSGVSRYFQRFLLYSERFTADVKTKFSGLLKVLIRELKMVVEKYRNYIEVDVKLVFEAIAELMCSTDSTPSRPGPCT